MKKVNINFILSLLIIIALFALAVFCLFLGGKLDAEVLETTGNNMQETMQGGDIGDVEGYGLIAQGIGYGFAFLGYIVFIILAILIGGYAVLMLVFAAVARVIFSNERLLAYRILMGIEYFLQIALELFILTMLVDQFAVWWLVTELLLVSITVYCMINTYSARIIDKSAAQDMYSIGV